MVRGSLGFLLFVPCLSCASTPPQPPAEGPAARGVLAAVRRHGAEVTALLARAGGAPRPAGAGFSWPGRHLVAEAPASAEGALHLRVAEAACVVRAIGPAGTARVEGPHLTYDGATHETVLFRVGDALESLVRMPRAGSLAYVFEHAPHQTLRRVEDGQGGTIELVADGRAVLRMTADRAWDAVGRALPVTLVLRGDRVEVHLPPDALHPVVIDPTWSSTRTPVRLRTHHTATTLGDGRILFAGGDGTATAEIFDPTTGRFSSVGAMGEARARHLSTLLSDGRVLVAGGGSSTAELFDPGTRTFAKTGAMTVGRLGAAGVLLPSGNVLVGGGASTVEQYDPKTGTFAAIAGKKTSASSAPVLLAGGDVLIYGPGVAETYRPSTATFTSMTAPADALATFTGVALRDGRALIVGVTGAMSTGGPPTYTTEAFVFSPPSTFTSTAKLGSPPIESAILLPSGKVLHVGDAGAELWNPTTGAFAPVAGVPPGHVDGTLTLLPSGDTLLVGGTGASGVDVFRAQDPGGPGAWSSAPSLDRPRFGARASVLLDGRVAVVGGSGDLGTTAPDKTLEIFTPKTATWGPVRSLVAARTGHSQIVLPSGKLLVVGAGSAAELFDPTTETASATGSMAVARTHPGVALLPSGKVLVAGGGVATAEVYDPATGTFAAPFALSAKRGDTAAVLLPTGLVLVFDAAGADLYAPATGTVTPTATPVGAGRDVRTAQVLLGGDVVVGGGSVAAFDRFDPSLGAWSLTTAASPALGGRGRTAALAGGAIVSAGGFFTSEATLSSFQVLSAIGGAGAGDFYAAAPMPLPTADQVLTWVPEGGVLLVGGQHCAGICFPEHGGSAARFLGLAPDTVRPTLSSVPAKVTAGVPFKVAGARLLGVGGHVGGNARVPTALFVPSTLQGQLLGVVTAFGDTEATVTLPATAYTGKGWLAMSVDGMVGPAVPVEVAAAGVAVPCAADGQCASGFCVDGVCCDARCDGACQACTKARKGSGDDGVCGAIPPGKDPKDACASFQGAPCTTAAECATGQCVDGVCCDTACGSQCEACDVEGSKGTCVPVIGKPHGARAPCEAGAEACAARRCDGVARDRCAGFEPTTTACRPASCVAGVETLASSCDGAGACPTATTKKCEPFACGDKTCLGKCSVDAECAPSYRCAEGKCVTGAFCDGDHTVKIPGGASTDCTPYRCEGAACKRSCGSSSDCVGGYLCQDGACVAAAAGTTTDDGGGCAVGAPEGRGARVVALAALAALLVGRRRRSRR